MLRRISVILLLALTATLPSVSMACAASCAMGDMGMGAGSAHGDSLPCHDEGSSSDALDGSDTDGAMASMCAFAACATIASSGTPVTAHSATSKVQSDRSLPASFFTFPPDEPPKA